MFRKLIPFLLLFGVALVQAELKPEPFGVIRTLETPYPSHWIIAQDVSFFHFSDGKAIVLDPLGEDLGQQYKGMMNSALVAPLAISAARNEIYFAET